MQSVDNLDVFLDGIAEESWLKFFSDDNSGMQSEYLCKYLFGGRVKWENFPSN